jgi:putative methionine-R-sulfoxide reductase with GAF domain/predicted Ser/Thr protein kinase
MARQSDRPTGPLSELSGTPPPAEQTLAPGTLLGSRYQILSVLGFGGMGVVYRALDRRLEQEIALKRLRPDRISREKREHLRREIILSRKVTHENVCRIYDLEEIGGVEYVSMEYIRGRSLKDIEEAEEVLPIGRGLSIAKGLCRGLAAAHRIGVLHRDIKPENVIIDEEGRPRLMDFGIAIDRSQSWTEQSGTVPGTPQFLAPELLRGAAPDARSDLYALGILFFEMFTGKVPFDDPETPALIRKILHEEAPDVSTLRPEFPPELAAILKRAISKDPAGRFARADEISAAIEAYEGTYLDSVLREVSVAKAKSVKLMVMLEANKALASTLDPTTILQIILRTATEETDAERGTIFLVEPETRTLVSQILEGGAVDPIRLPWGHGIAGACAAEGKPILTVDVKADPRHERGPDSTSGFKTQSILAVPMKGSGGEVVGVIEVLNKRRRKFSPEDEEFLVTVAEHAALAVISARQHHDTVDRAARDAERRILRNLHPLLAPARWPETPGYESAPLRWSSEAATPIAYDVRRAGSALVVALAEQEGDIGAGLAGVLAAVERARRIGAEEELAAAFEDLVSPPERVVLARLHPDRVEFAASAGTSLPFLYRDRRPVPFASRAQGRLTRAEAECRAGDLVLVPSRGALELSGGAMGRAAALAERADLEGAFTELVSGWKADGKSPGSADALILGFRRLGPASVGPKAPGPR